jgi:hypothetical protein
MHVHQLFIYADDISLLGENTNTIKSSKTRKDIRKEVDLEINAEKIICSYLITRMQNKII